MKYIKEFFNFNPFRKKSTKDSEIEEELEEIPVRWTGAYLYRGKSYMLQIGDYTNKGFITDIIPDIHTYYVTPEGAFSPDKLIVFKGDIDKYITQRKYNL